MKRIFIDFDGVIIDTQYDIERIKVSEYKNLTWEEFSKAYDWNSFYANAKIINDSINILKNIKDDNVFIITKTDSIKEQEAKLRFLRENGINLSVFFVPFSLNKSSIINPNENDYLIDDNQNNISEWTNMGGCGIYFDSTKKLDNLMEDL